MKKYSTTLALLIAAGLCTSARANLFSDNFDTTVVAERGKDAPPAQDSPIACALVDGGYIEAGDPIAGENPPSAASVRQELLDALGQQNFHVGAASPTVLLTYYWGVLRIDHTAIRLPMGINANQDARIKLVSTEETGAEVENHILSAKRGADVNLDASSPVLLVGPLDTIVQNARHPRYFIVVSAYQYQAPGESQKPTLLWRAKLSAQETSGDMDEVIPALIAKGAPFFGKDMQYPKTVENTLMKSVTVAPSTQNSNGQTGMASDDAASPAVGALVQQERTSIAGTGNGKG
jgi:hypothetical protein